jgi:hypothetical protein
MGKIVTTFSVALEIFNGPTPGRITVQSVTRRQGVSREITVHTTRRHANWADGLPALLVNNSPHLPLCGNSAAWYVLGQQGGHVRVRAPGQDFFLVLHRFLVAVAFPAGCLDNRTAPVVSSAPFEAPFALPDEVCHLTNGLLYVSIRVRHSLLLIRKSGRGTAGNTRGSPTHDTTTGCATGPKC